MSLFPFEQPATRDTLAEAKAAKAKKGPARTHYGALSDDVAPVGGPLGKADIESLPSVLADRISINQETGCWEVSKGTLRRDGYARTTWNGKDHRFHRIVAQILIGRLSESLALDHLCRVRHCANPNHLEQLTIAENVMRGTSIPARNAAKTHCKRGHEFTPDNTRTAILPNGTPSRLCRTCKRDADRRYREMKKSRPIKRAGGSQ